VTERVVHKSDAGLVRLALGDAASVERAWHEIAGNLHRHSPGETLRISVQEMVAGELELIVGARCDPQFGPVVLVGSGGVFVELLHDVEMALAPIDEGAAEALMRRLRIWPLLAGFRGRPRLDIAAAAAAVSRVSRLAADAGERLVELDINPLIVRAGTGGVVAVDARAVLAC
jgi:acyl-CoA synthetase (NDP forming)